MWSCRGVVCLTLFQLLEISMEESYISFPVFYLRPNWKPGSSFKCAINCPYTAKCVITWKIA